MPGVTLHVEFDDREVREALERLARAGADLAPAMRETAPATIMPTTKHFFLIAEPYFGP